MMRTIIALTLGIAVASVAFAQNPGDGENSTLVEVLSSEGVLAYRRVPETQVYELKLLSEDAIQQSRAYYANRGENLTEYRRLQGQHQSLAREVAKRRARGEAPGDAEADLRALKEKLERVSRPTGFYRVAEVTRRGADFIGVQEFGGSRELLIPVYQIKHVIVRESRAEQTHPLEPAAGPGLDGTSSPPAQ